MNPYEPPKPEPATKPLICEKCNAIDSRPLGIVGNTIVIALVVALGCLAAKGLLTTAEQYGIVDKAHEHFWFEEPLRRWIHGR